MSERITKPTDAAKAGWRTNAGSPNASTEPNASKRADGWPLNAPFPHDEGNWQFNLLGALSLWLTDTNIRAFSELADAINATDPPTQGRVFRVPDYDSGTGWRRPYGQSVYSLTPAGFTAITDAATDGGRDFWMDTASNIYAADPIDGSQIFAVSPVNILATCLGAEGRDVYVSGDATFPGLVRINRDTGAIFDRTGTPYGMIDIAANGQYVATAGGTGATFQPRMYVYSVATTPSVEIGFFNHGNIVYAVAVDDSKAYFGGAQGTGAFDVRARDLATIAGGWDAALPTISAPAVRGICTDGRLVYVSTDRVQTVGVGGDPYATLFALSCQSGAYVWHRDAQVAAASTDNGRRVHTDGRRLLLGTDNVGGLGMIVDVVGDPVVTQNIPGVTDFFDFDGTGALGTTGAGVTSRFRGQAQDLLFEIGNGVDPYRSPYHKLATPVW